MDRLGRIYRSILFEHLSSHRQMAFVSGPRQVGKTTTCSELGDVYLKAVDGWTDQGLGEFELFYLRDKQKREVDFAVVRDGKPFFLVEAKSQENTISPSLVYLHDQLGCEHSFQAIVAADYVDTDAFSYLGPVSIPFRTLFSQLL